MSKDFNSDIKRQGTPASMFFQTAPQPQPEVSEDIDAQREKIREEVREEVRQEERAKLYAEIARETKSKKLQLLVYPSIYNKFKELADRQGTSVNNLINEIMREYVDGAGKE